jgi:hypothetical protein
VFAIFKRSDGKLSERFIFNIILQQLIRLVLRPSQNEAFVVFRIARLLTAFGGKSETELPIAERIQIGRRDRCFG